MSNLSSTTSQYHFTEAQQNAIDAPVLGAYFGEMDQVYETDNASTKAQYGTSTTEEQLYNASNYQFFNNTLELGLDCGRANTAGGRPNQSAATGSACYPPSISSYKAARQLDANYNSYGPNATQVVLAEGDIRYAPARYVDLNNYAMPSISDMTFQPRLMGTRDMAGSGCSVDMEGGLSVCAIADDPLPFKTSADPRVSYGVDEPHSQYWSGLGTQGVAPAGCASMNGGQYPDSVSSVCGLKSVEPNLQRPRAGQYMADAGTSVTRVRM